MIDNPVAVLVDTKKQCVLESFANGYHPTYGLGTMSGNIYDTAWVSMVRKPTTNGHSLWAFPAAIEALLQQQSPCGSWGDSVSRLDAIASTLAALLALQRHAADADSRSDIHTRILKAKAFLDTALKDLDGLLTTCTLPVSLELRLPALLALLGAEGHTFDYDRTYLTKLQMKKMSKINLEAIFNGPQSSLLHSVEVLIGKIDFQTLAKHKVLGSILASPSATAAYLMYNPVWDEEAEAYLQCAMSNGAGQGSGLVAAGYPTTVFEWAWVTKNLIRYGVEPSSSLREIGKQVEHEIKLHGLIGFVPKACPDADDTAMSLIALMLQGTRYSPQGLIDQFEREHHFATYPFETHTSVSANANVLSALVLLSTDDRYLPQIEKCIRYLCGAWFDCHRMVQDKWNISPYYPTMLTCEALMSYLQRWSKGELSSLPDDLMKVQLPITLFQALVRTLRTQNADGSWGTSNSAEETAYALLILKSVGSFSFTELIAAEVQEAVQRGRQFILKRGVERSPADDQLWLDKTLYAIPTVSDVYIMGAIQEAETDKTLAEIPAKLVDVPAMTVHKMGEYFARLPSQSETAKWVLQASVIEALLMSHRLKTLDIFSTGRALGDKYIKYAACFWTLANNASPEYLFSTAVIYSMVEFSVGIFQEDELMEKALLNLPDSSTALLADYLDRLCGDKPVSNGSSTITNTPDADIDSHLETIQQNISLWFRFALENNLPSKTTTTSPYDRREFQQELKLATLAAMQQAQASSSSSPQQTFYTWLHTTAVHDVKSAIVSKSLICKIGPAHKTDPSVFTTAREKYLAEKLFRQISIEGRLWNDLGSIERDRAAGNLNSIDFAEFSGGGGDARAELTRLAEYEHKCTVDCLEELTGVLEEGGRGVIALYLRMYYACCVNYSETCAMYAFASTTAS
ncbi:terpenoid cyclases/protein prenyltransferase alpha-alpha toroid [Aspergillus egyptiacus]|nr:terpenoid cyclases/protein prenyltransferase alpha-alpha toroid [Aspergillus egyptiacus]